MAAPPGSRAVRPVLLEGDLLAARYRLVRPVPPASTDPSGPAVLWLAQDEVLARPVAAKVLAAGGRRGAAAARPFLEAAAASGMLSHPVLARVYDAAVEQRPAEQHGRPAGEVDVAYVISEWVDGPTLAGQLLEHGPYDAPEAVDLIEELLEALAAAHAGGLVHGRVHPGNVMLTRNGALKLTDLATSAVLPDRAVPAERAGDPGPEGADVRDAAAVLYGALTARWPTTITPQPTGGLPPAPAGRDAGSKRGRLVSPRQVRAGLPMSLDAVVTRALDPVQARVAPAVDTAAGLATALDQAVPVEPVRTAPAAFREPRLPPWARRLAAPVVVVGLLVALGIGTYSIGRDIGTIDTPGDRLAAASPGAVVSSPGERLALGSATVTDYDPPPGDGGERPGEIGNAYDDDVSTAWRTDRYDTATFGGRKDGVGLLVDLGAPTAVGRVELALATDGTVVELRAADERADAAGGFPLLAQGRSAGGALALDLPAGTMARYYLIWITGLPPVDDGFAAGVQELRLLQP